MLWIKHDDLFLDRLYNKENVTIQLSEITAANLRKSLFARSYKKLEVEDYFEAVRFVLNKNPDDLHNSELKQLQKPTFSIVRFRRGYDMHDVNALVDETDEVIKGYIKPRRH